MKKIIFALCMFVLCGCSQKGIHTCQMTSNEYEWKLEYETDEDGNVTSITQSVVVEVSNDEEKETYQKLLDDMFDEYIAQYSGACSLEKTDLDSKVSRSLKVDYHLLTEEQKDEMSFEKEEKLLKAQLEYAGYKCK